MIPEVSIKHDRQSRISQHLRNQRGVGLIEVLFAVLILAVGLLGMAGLQLTSIRASQSAMTRGMAVVQAYSIIAAMQADKEQGVDLTTYNIALGTPDPTGTSFRDAAIANWYAAIRNAMGNATTSSGGINCTSITGTADFDCTVTVQWDDSRVQDRGATTSTVPATLQLEVVI